MDAEWTDVGGGGSLDCLSCLEPFSSQGEHVPLSLLCGHSICQACAQGCRGDTFKCPLRCVEVSEAWANRTLQTLLPNLQLLNKARSEARCENCDEQPAQMVCEDCRCELCGSCAQAIHAARALRKHRVGTISGRDRSQLCGAHQEQMELVCTDCVCLICRACVAAGHHAGHSYEPHATALPKLRSTLTKALEATQVLAKRAQQAAALVDQELLEIHMGRGDREHSSLPNHDSHPNPHHNNRAAQPCTSRRHEIVQHFDRLQDALQRRRAEVLTEFDQGAARRASMLCEQRAQISTLHTTASLVLSEVQAILEGGDGALLGQFLRCQEILDALNSIVVPEVPSVPPEMLVAFPESLITQLRQHGVVESSCEDELERVTARAEVAEEALRKTQKALELALAREAAAVRMPRSMWGSGDTLVRGSRPLAQTSRLQMFGY